MPNLAENKWSIISVIVAVVGIIINILVQVLVQVASQETKSLSVVTVSRAVLVNLAQPEDRSLIITYNGTPISHLTAATIEIRNDGSRTIDRSDFEGPLIIRFPEHISVLAATLGEKTPADLQPQITLESGLISIAPLLLNPRDRFRITAQVRGEFNEPDVVGRISGVGTISRQVFRNSATEQRPIMLIAIGFLSTLVYFYFGGSIFLARRSARPVLLPVPISFGIFFILGIVSASSLVGGARSMGWSTRQMIISFAVIGLVGAATFVITAYELHGKPLTAYRHRRRRK